MSRNYDNWERLVAATLDREKLRELARCPSIDTSSFRSSISSSSLDFDFEFPSPMDTGFTGSYSSLLNSSSNWELHNKAAARAVRGKMVSGDGLEVSNSSSKTSLASVPVAVTPQIEGEILQSPSLKRFALRDLWSATRYFDSGAILGKWSSGNVFKGWIDEHTLVPTSPGSGMAVAIKKLNQSAWLEGHEEWLAQINYLGQLQHPNLVKLIGYCSEDDRRLLVYEFMPRGSMKNHLFRIGSYSQPLPWIQRMKIALGAAKGLAFLHGAEIQVVHGNISLNNFLLDSSYNVKLSDFGVPGNGLLGWIYKEMFNSYVHCDDGYDAPEYWETRCLTAKSDVYSFGVVLLEILTGRRALDRNLPRHLVQWTKPYLTKKHGINIVLDPRLEGQYSLKQAATVVNLILQCVSRDPRERPNMNAVVAVLEQLQNWKTTRRTDARHRQSKLSNKLKGLSDGAAMEN